jgi:hypothetical protein
LQFFGLFSFSANFGLPHRVVHLPKTETGKFASMRLHGIFDTTVSVLGDRMSGEVAARAKF